MKSRNIYDMWRRVYRVDMWKYLILLFLVLLKCFQNRSINGASSTNTISSTNRGNNANAEYNGIPFVIAMCRGTTKENPVSGVSAENMQRRQVEVLIKSAVALSRRKIKFVVITDHYELFRQLSSRISLWLPSYRSRLILQYRPIYTPQGGNILEVYEKCSAERLFLPWALPDEDAVAYLDTDMFFLRPPEDLLDLMRNFDGTQFVGATPVDGYYLQYAADKPYYGSQGLSAALLLANLTRWRQLPLDWRNKVEAINLNYKGRLEVGDQDILNMIFSEFPQYVYDIGCEWSGIIEQCTTSNWGCRDIEEKGFALVHGARWRFFRDTFNNKTQLVVPMKIMFRAWEQHQLGTPVAALLQKMLYVLRDQETKLGNFCKYDVEKLFRPLKTFTNNKLYT